MPELIDRLQELLKDYASAEQCEPQNAFRDILTDLRHLADEFGYDFGERDKQAYQVYLEELHATGRNS